MFKIEAFVDDKKLPVVMHALNGHIIGSPVVLPVANAKVENGKVKAKTSGDLLEMLATWIKERKLTEVNPNVLRAFLIDSGRSAGSYSDLLTRAKKAKMLKIKAGSKTHGVAYQVLK
jgi:hypothetical protein